MMIKMYNMYAGEKIDKMWVQEKDNNIYLRETKDFSVEQTLECGQCFHFVKLGENHYGISARNHMLEISQEKDTVILHNISMDEYLLIWKDYFDLDRDYGQLKRELLERDDRLREAMDTMWGVRILNQEYFETLISFIISQNNHIPRIKQLVAKLSKEYGEYLGTIGDEEFYSFPSVDILCEIGEDVLRELKVGFRAPYITDACRCVKECGMREEIFIEKSEEEARKELMKIKGVGEKVANCVLLFGLGYRGAFPIDVWIKRIMEAVYFEGETPKDKIAQKASELFGEYGGYAQQYLFYYGKKMKIGTK